MPYSCHSFFDDPLDRWRTDVPFEPHNKLGVELILEQGRSFDLDEGRDAMRARLFGLPCYSTTGTTEAQRMKRLLNYQATKQQTTNSGFLGEVRMHQPGSLVSTELVLG